MNYIIYKQVYIWIGMIYPIFYIIPLKTGEAKQILLMYANMFGNIINLGNMIYVGQPLN